MTATIFYAASILFTDLHLYKTGAAGKQWQRLHTVGSNVKNPPKIR